MLHYFSKVTASHWSSKNELQKSVRKIAYDLERKLISESELPEFEDGLKDRIEALNKQYPRCKPVDVEFYQEPFPVQDPLSQRYYSGKDRSWIVPGVFHLTLFCGKG